jgi:hypothetical protein
MVGRFGGAQVLKRGWMGEALLLSTALCGSVLCGIIVALFSGQVRALENAWSPTFRYNDTHIKRTQ